MTSGYPTRIPVLVVVTMLAASGCKSPLADLPQQQVLQRSVVESIDRELTGIPVGERLLASQGPSAVEEELASRRLELDELSPAMEVELGGPDSTAILGPNLSGAEQKSRALSLRTAIITAAQDNLGVQIASLQPAINDAEVVAAESAFDAIFYGTFDYNRIDQPSRVPVLGGIPLGTSSTGSDGLRFETGIRQPLISGGEVFVSTDLSRTKNRTPGIEFAPDPAWDAGVRVGLSQPLLRGFGSDVNTATIRIARNTERRSIQQLRGELLQVVADTELAYWDLALAWRDLYIRQWLLQVGYDVRDKLAGRRDFDTTTAQYSDAVATVERRKSDLIRSQRVLRAASDELKALMNDPAATVGSEILLAPIDDMVDAEIVYDLREAIMTGLSFRPEIQEALLNIDDASIREQFANNLRLPLLNLTAEAEFLGQDDRAGGAYGNVDGNFVDYVVGMLLEVPIGNRRAEAEYRRARLERSGQVVAYRLVVQDVVLDVKRALRNVIASYDLIKATRSSRVAAAENLRALLAEEETLASLTPEFLNLKFDRQEGLALARFEELQALVGLDKSIADLYRAMGLGLKVNQIELEVVDEPLPSRVGNAPGR